MMALIEFFAGFGFWNWVFLGLALCALESVISGVHFLWFGISAVATGLLVMLTQALGMPLSWPLQMILFAALAVASVLGVRRYAPPHSRSDLPDLNVRGAQLIGRTAIVESAIAGGRGRVRVGDTVWAAQGPDLPTGSEARITGADNTVLIVERA